jgi:hypothetical protein
VELDERRCCRNNVELFKLEERMIVNVYVERKATTCIY